MDTEQLMMKKSLYEGETWLGKPPEIEESRIEKTMEADVVVVGAGLAVMAVFVFGWREWLQRAPQRSWAAQCSCWKNVRLHRRVRVILP